MAHSLVDSKELMPTPPPASPPSAFLWAGLALLVTATVLGAAAIIQSAMTRTGLPQNGLLVAFFLFLAGVTLLFAQSRYLFWRQAAGIVQPHPLAPVTHRVRDPAERFLQKGDALLLLGLTLLALLPRLPALHHSLWYDELWTLEFMRHGPLYALTNQSGFNNHLLNSLLGSLTLQAFGMSETPNVPPAWMVRLPALVFGVLSVPMLYLAAREAFRRQVGIAAAVLLAFSPHAVDMSTQARGYSAMIFFTVAQAYFLCRALRFTSASAWIGWLICSALGVLAHLYFAYVVALNVVYLCLRAVWRSAHLRSNPHAIALLEQAGTMTVAWAVLFFAEYVGVGMEMVEESQRVAATTPVARAHEIVVPLLQLWGGVPGAGALFVYYVVCGLLALLGLWYLMRQPSGGVVYLPLLLIAPLLISELAKPHYLYMRFFAFGLPLFLALMACGLTYLATLVIGQNEARRNWRYATVVLLAGLFSLLTGPGLYEVLRLPKQDYAGVAQGIQAEGNSDRLVAVGMGAKWFQSYGLNVELPETPHAIRALAQEEKPLLIIDTDLTVNPRLRTPPYWHFVYRNAGRPERVFPGRFRGWPYRWLDGNSDIKLYRVE